MKFIEEKIIKLLMILSMIVVFGFVISIIYTILVRGSAAMSWEVISQVPSGGF